MTGLISYQKLDLLMLCMDVRRTIIDVGTRHTQVCTQSLSVGRSCRSGSLIFYSELTMTGLHHLLGLTLIRVCQSGCWHYLLELPPHKVSVTCPATTGCLNAGHQHTE